MKKFIELLTDQEFDAESGLYNYDARMYDPVVGRFISPDNVIPDQYNPQSLNRYSYCRNNPLIYTDPTGHVDEYVLQTIYVHATPLSEWLNDLARAHNFSWNLLMLVYGPGLANFYATATYGAYSYKKPYSYGGIAEGEVGLNLLKDGGTPKNRLIYAGATSYVDDEGRYTVHAHSDGAEIYDTNVYPKDPISAKDLARTIDKDPNYGGQDILLLACKTGLGGNNSFAYDLQSELLELGHNVSIFAPTGKVAYPLVRDSNYEWKATGYTVLNGGQMVTFDKRYSGQIPLISNGG